MAILKYQTCGTCGAQQELPAIFCSACGGPLIRISKIFLTFFLTFTVAAFVVYGIKADGWLWPWPLYAYFAILFVLYSFAVTRRYTVVTLRMLAWCSILAYAMWFFWLSMDLALKRMSSDISDILTMVVDQPIPRYIFVGAVVLELIFAFVILKRRFGFFNGYRVNVTLLAGAAYCGKLAYTYSTGEAGVSVSPKLSDWFLWAPDREVKELFELLAVNLLRVVVAEMAVYSFVKSVRPANEAYHKIAIQKAQASPAGASAAMLDAISRVSGTILRSALLFRFFVTEYIRTFGSYLYALYRTLRRIVLDLVLPAISLACAAYILGMLAEHTAAYITGKAGMRLIFWGPLKSSAAMIPVCLVMIFIVQMIFLKAVTKFSFRALTRCNSLLMLWLAPFVLALFVFVSLSLAATGSVLQRWESDMAFPFRIGPLTIISIVLLLGLVAFSLLHSRRAGSAHLPEPDKSNPPTTPDGELHE